MLISDWSSDVLLFRSRGADDAPGFTPIFAPVFARHHDLGPRTAQICGQIPLLLGRVAVVEVGERPEHGHAQAREFADMRRRFRAGRTLDRDVATGRTHVQASCGKDRAALSAEGPAL